MQTRKEQAAVAKKNILKAAYKLIRNKGYDSIHIKEITAECGMSPGNFYHYFQSKKELFDQLDSEDFYEDFTSLQIDNKINVTERLKSYITQWISHSVNDYGSNYMFYWTKYYICKVNDFREHRLNVIYGHIVYILKSGITSGELKQNTPIETIAISITYAIYGSMVHFASTEESKIIIDWAEDFFEKIILNTLNQYLS